MVRGSIVIVLVSCFCIAKCTELPPLVISSLKKANSFIYRSGQPVKFHDNSSDIWRICPPKMNSPQLCFPSLSSGPGCSVLTPDCRCYNWAILESEFVLEKDGCVYVYLSSANPSVTKLVWQMSYTYPVLPLGYDGFLSILYSRLLSKRLSETDYKMLTAPLICDRASEQYQSLPDIESCTNELIINLTYIPSADFYYNPPASSGQTFVVVVFSISVFLFSIKVLRIEAHLNKFKKE